MNYVVIDTETTGMEPPDDRVVEIATVVRRDNRYLETMSALCDPERDIPPVARAVHHISPADVAGKISHTNAVRTVLVTHEGRVFVAHNAAFDRRFIDPETVSLGVPIPRWLCTWRCAMHIWPDAPSHSNQVLRYWLELDPAVPSDLFPHRALYDAIVTEAILQKMLETHTLDQLVELSSKPVILSTVRFGKHRGLAWKDVPRDYLQWIVRQTDMDADTRHTAAHWLRPSGTLV